MQFDIINVEESYSYELKILTVLVVAVLDGLEGTGLKHFNIKFFLSLDESYDDMDTTIIIPLGADQEAQLSVQHIFIN